MAKVRAKTKGYIGFVLREAGEVFEWPDDQPLGSWVTVLDGGPVVAADVKPTNQKADAEKVKAEKAEAKKANGSGGKKAETVQAPTAAPFDDAPAPVRVNNEINDALGSTQPDWLPPSDDKPVQADD